MNSSHRVTAPLSAQRCTCAVRLNRLMMIGWTRMPSRITASVYGMDSNAAPAGTGHATIGSGDWCALSGASLAAATTPPRLSHLS